MDLRFLNDKDIPLIEDWLNRDHVKRWYEVPRLGITIDDWVSEIKRYKDEFSWITYYIVICDSRPIGFCLYYRAVDSIGEDFGALPLEGSYGIDYMFGEENLLGKGLGKEMVHTLVEKIFSLQEALRITADVDQKNMASQKTLLACGFTLLDSGSAPYVQSESNRYVLTRSV